MLAALAACTPAEPPVESGSAGISELPSATEVAQVCGIDDDPEPTGDQVLVFFGCAGPGVLPTLTSPVVRDAPPNATSEERLAFAVRELMSGPSPSEVEDGFGSAFGAGAEEVDLDVAIEGEPATVNFGDFRAGMPSTSASLGALVSQLRDTIFQFDDVQTAELQLNGSCVDFWTYFQAVCTPLTPDP